MTIATQYDPAKVSLVIAAPPFWVGAIEGFAEGTFLTLKRSVATMRLIPGVGDQSTRARNKSLRGEITFTVEQGSDCNIGMTALAAADRATGLGVFPIGMWDRSSVVEFGGAPKAFLEGVPPNEKGQKSGTVRWRVLAPLLFMTHGGLRQV